MGTATWNIRRPDVENLPWNINRFYVQKLPQGGQILYNVESTSILTSTYTVQLVWIFFASNQRRFYVEKYLCGHGRFFNVDSTLKFPHPQGLSIHQRRI